MKKIFSFLSSLLLFTIIAISFSVQQSSAVSNLPIPEKNGDYPDPEHPGIRVRVFVHEPKQGKPEQNPSLVCSSDPDSVNNTAAANWHLPSAWTYRLNPSSVPQSVGGNNLQPIASNAFAQWTNALTSSSSKPNITKGADTNVNKQAYDAQNVIAWGRTSGTALGVTYIRYNTTTGTVVDVDTIMNQKFTWSWNGGGSAVCANENSYDAQNILTHELGHWMGLDDMYDSSLYANNTMYGYGAKGEVKKDTLTTGDAQGLQSIYR